MKIRPLRVAGAFALMALLGGCASEPKTRHTPALYQWGAYQENVDSYLRGDKASPQDQIQLIEADLQTIRSSGGVVPPGYQAHLGLLYVQQGRHDQFVEQVNAEKQQFPESETFMNFLLRNFNK